MAMGMKGNMLLATQTHRNCICFQKLHYMKEFPSRLKALRKEFGLNQTDMAADVGLSPSGYQCYEQGKGLPDVPRLYQLAEYFGVSIDYLLGRTEKREINQ